jgi:hypothetical protein
MVKVAFPGCTVEDRGSYLIARGLLSAAQLKRADRYFGSRPVQRQLEESLMYDSDRPVYKSRRSRDALLPVRERPWLFKRLAGISKAADVKFKALRYRARDGVVQPRYDELQYAEYHGSDGGHFGEWHTDAPDDGVGDRPRHSRPWTLVQGLDG